MSEATDLKAYNIDQLILDIFAQRAASHEGKVQVELALTKIYVATIGNGDKIPAFSRLAGGLWPAVSETKLETDRRRVMIK